LVKFLFKFVFCFCVALFVTDEVEVTVVIESVDELEIALTGAIGGATDDDVLFV